MVKYLRRTASGAASNGLGTSAHNERRRGQRPKPMPGITHSPCLLHASFASKQSSIAEAWGLYLCPRREGWVIAIE
jgi:hypothetical protein